MLKKGCKAFLDTMGHSMWRLCRHSYCLQVSGYFFEDFPGLSPNKEMSSPMTSPVSKAPYWMAPIKPKDLKEQLQELLDKDFIRPNVSPSRAPIVCEKEDGSMRLSIIGN